MCIVGLHAGMQDVLRVVNVGSICWVGLMLGQFASRVGGPDARSLSVSRGWANVRSICVWSGRKDVQSIAR